MPNATTKIALLGLVLVIGAALLAVDSFRSAKTRRATSEWHACAHDTAERTLERELTTTSEVLMQSILSECKRQYDAVVSKCGSEENCATTVQHKAIVRSNSIRNEIIWAREQAKKRSQIEAAVQELERIGVHRDGIKDFFRDEILDDAAAEKNAEDEAKAAADGDRERRW
jgi:hypothetical protein